MTDAELISLLRQKGPQELSESELSLLRSRMHDSPELREALASHVELEELLVSSLAAPSFTADDVERRAVRPAPPPTASNPASLAAILGSALLVLFIVAVAFYGAMVRPHREEPVALQPATPVDSPPVEADPAAESDPAEPTPDPVAPAPRSPSDPPPGEPSSAPQPAADPPAAPEPPPAPAPAPLKAVAVRTKADQFARGDVERRAEPWGLAEVRFVDSSQPAFAEYEIEAPRDGDFELMLRGAAPQNEAVAQENEQAAAPLTVIINGREVGPVAGEFPAARHAAQADWVRAGEFAFRAGKNTLRLVSRGAFPRLVEVAVASQDGARQIDRLDPQAVDVEKNAPWGEAFAGDFTPADWTVAAFSSFPTGKERPTRDALQGWLAKVPDRQSAVTERGISGGPCGAIDGVVRLKVPWTRDSVLRLSWSDAVSLQMHFFSGERGASVVWYRHQEDFENPWLGYATERKPGEPVPSAWQLTASDDGRARRTGMDYAGPVEFRYRAGQVIVSRGDVTLLTAPLAEPPEEVYLEGVAAIRGIQLTRVVGDPPPSPTWGDATESIAPATLTWEGETRKEVGKAEKRADGAVVLSADKPPHACWFHAPLPRRGLYAVEFRCEELTPGIGFYLGNDKESQLQVLFVEQERRQPFVRWAGHGRSSPQSLPRVNDQVIRWMGPNAWVRLLVGTDVVHGWVSADGVHWGRLNPYRADLRNYTHLGVTLAEQISTKVVLRELRTRDVAALTDLAPRELVEQVPLDKLDYPGGHIGQWRKMMLEGRPADADYTEWQRACVVAVLGRGVNRYLGTALLDTLCNDLAAENAPVQQQLEVIAANMLLSDPPDNSGRIKSVADRYHRLAEQLYRQGNPRPLSAVRWWMMATPVQAQHKFRVMSESLGRWELLEHLSAGRNDEALEFCRRLRFFEMHGFAALVPWGEFAAASQSGASTPSPSETRPEWRSLLVEELSKEAYNVLAEFQAVIESNSPQEAARMITQVDPQVAIGLAPSGADRQLLVSAPVAFAAALRSDPQLAAAMRQEYGALAQLRVKQAIAEGNPLAVQLITIRYQGTEAAAEAQRWLGDRALSGGQFSLALSHYARAREHAAPLSRSAIEVRARLAAAMLGQEYGQRATTSVEFGEMLMSADEYEAMIADALKSHAPQGGSSRAATDVVEVPPPGLYKATKLARFDGEAGEHPGNPEHRHVRGQQIAWVDRQIATTVDGDRLYVTNRFNVSAYELPSGKRLWQSTSGSKSGLAHSWTLVPMRPIVHGSLVIARQMSEQGPVLCAFKRDGGQLAWKAAAGSGEHFASDPVLFHETLYVAVSAREQQEGYAIRLATYDAGSGQRLSLTPLVQLREPWWERKVGQLVAVDDGLVLVLGGVVLNCDLAGQLRWVRRELLLPAEQEPQWVRQHHQLPLVHEGKLIIAQPGVRSVSLVDAATGRLEWRAGLPDVERVVGVTAGRVIVRTAEGLAALAWKDGAVQWQTPVTNLLDAQLTGRGPIVVSQAQSVLVPSGHDPRFVPSLVWLDAGEGRLLARSPLEEWNDPAPQLGHLVVHGKKLFALAGKGLHDPHRDLIELTRSGDAPPPSPEPQPPPSVQSQPDEVQVAAWRLFPGWLLADGSAGGDVGYHPERKGEKHVVGVRLGASRTVGFRRLGSLNREETQLRGKVWIPTSVQTRLEVRFQGKVVWKEEFEKKSEPHGWKEFNVDLTPQAKVAGGATGELLVLVVVEAQIDGDPGPVFWQKLELSR